MTEYRCVILVVDDDAFVLNALKALLSIDYQVFAADSAEKAEEIFRQHTIDILLTDQRMPGKSGVELLEWTEENSPQTIRLLMTGFNEIDDAISAINTGHVYYYLTKPWRTGELLQILKNAAEKVTLVRKREQLLSELQRLNQELETRVETRTRQLQQANQLLELRNLELERLALTDPLTGLFNRRAIEELAQFEIKRHIRYPNALSIGLLDIDKFKDINTQYLFTGGDEVLKQIAKRLHSTVREVDSVGRMGGEEFLVIARETNYEGVAILAERIRSAIENTTIEYQGQKISVTISGGFVVAESGVKAELSEVLKLASRALSEAKETGRNRWVIHAVSAAEALESIPR